MEDLLRLNLQFFSEESADDGATDVTVDEEKANTDEGKQSDKEEKLFTQEEVNAIISERLARDKRKRDEESEKRRLEEQGEYKQLLEKANETIAEYERKEALALRSKTITEKLLEKGVKHEDVPRYARYVDKMVETDEDIEQAVNTVYEDLNLSHIYSDPAAGFGESKQREQKSATEYGAELFKKLGR